MADEKILTLNVRKDLLRTKTWKRGGSVAGVLRKKIQKMFKEQRLIIDKGVNEEIWKRGMKNPPMRLRLKATKVDENTVRIELEK